MYKFTTNDVGKKTTCTHGLGGIAKGDILTIDNVLTSLELLTFKEMPNKQVHWSYFELFTPTLVVIINGRLVALQKEVPVCMECKHREWDRGSWCKRPSLPTVFNLFTGDKMIAAPRTCRDERESDSPYCCGINAQYFEPKQELLIT